MEHDDLDDILNLEPFRLLRFHITDGTVIEVDHPDMAMLGPSAIVLHLPPDDAGDRDAFVPLSSIVWVEVILRHKTTEGKSNGNGV